MAVQQVTAAFKQKKMLLLSKAVTTPCIAALQSLHLNNSMSSSYFRKDRKLSTS